MRTPSRCHSVSARSLATSSLAAGAAPALARSSDMRFSLEWLRDFVAVDLPAGEIAARLTDGGFEVGSWEPVQPPAGPGGGDAVFELDITANRPDAMNH